MPSLINATTTNGLVTSADNSGSLQLQTNSGTTAVTIDTSQRVGVGTTSPTGKLHVYGSGEVQTLQRSSGSANNYTLFKTESGADQAYLGFSDAGVNDFAIYNVQNGYVRIATNNTERMRITSSGDFFVGKTSSSTSTSGFEINALTGTSAYAVFTNTRTDGLGDLFILNRQGSTGTLINFFQANSSKGSITTNGSNVAYNTSSDYRLKENIAPMTGALAKVAQLKPCNWTWKINGSNGQGFIAHELQAVVPDAVNGEKDAVDAEGKPVYQGVDTSFLVATLTAAIQELKAELDATKAEVQALKGVA